jgi:hypothetical protein
LFIKDFGITDQFDVGLISKKTNYLIVEVLAPQSICQPSNKKTAFEAIFHKHKVRRKI